jgi:hypothetical protein
MRTRHVAVAVVALVLGGMAVGSGAAYIEPYTGAGDWFSPGQARASQYDWCRYWTGNNFAKGSSAWGLVTFITPSGGWRYTVQKYGHIFRSISFDYRWSKKLYCRNTSSVGYTGGCWGDREDTTDTCV